MAPQLASVGFVSAPVALSSITSSFCAATTKKALKPRAPVVRREQRPRIVSLGAAPKPSSKEPDDETDATDSAPEEPAEEMTADDILNSPSFLKKKLEIVQKELIEAKAALEQDSEAVTAEKEKYVRLAADFENYRRRSSDDLRKQDQKSTAKVCKEILGVLDNFERAIKAVDATTEKEKVIDASYQSINRQLLDALLKLKVQPIDAVGEVFDPEIHEAIQKMESTEHKEDVVCAQYQRGYRIDSTLIRAAIVGVSTGPGPEEEETPAEEGETEEPAIEVDAKPEDETSEE